MSCLFDNYVGLTDVIHVMASLKLKEYTGDSAAAIDGNVAVSSVCLAGSGARAASPVTESAAGFPGVNEFGDGGAGGDTESVVGDAGDATKSVDGCAGGATESVVGDAGGATESVDGCVGGATESDIKRVAGEAYFSVLSGANVATENLSSGMRMFDVW